MKLRTVVGVLGAIVSTVIALVIFHWLAAVDPNAALTLNTLGALAGGPSALVLAVLFMRQTWSQIVTARRNQAIFDVLYKPNPNGVFYTPEAFEVLKKNMGITKAASND